MTGRRRLEDGAQRRVLARRPGGTARAALVGARVLLGDDRPAGTSGRSLGSAVAAPGARGVVAVGAVSGRMRRVRRARRRAGRLTAEVGRAPTAAADVAGPGRPAARLAAVASVGRAVVRWARRPGHRRVRVEAVGPVDGGPGVATVPEPGKAPGVAIVPEPRGAPRVRVPRARPARRPARRAGIGLGPPGVRGQVRRRRSAGRAVRGVTRAGVAGPSRPVGRRGVPTGRRPEAGGPVRLPGRGRAVAGRDLGASEQSGVRVRGSVRARRRLAGRPGTGRGTGTVDATSEVPPAARRDVGRPGRRGARRERAVVRDQGLPAVGTGRLPAGPTAPAAREGSTGGRIAPTRTGVARSAQPLLVVTRTGPRPRARPTGAWRQVRWRATPPGPRGHRGLRSRSCPRTRSSPISTAPCVAGCAP